MTWALVKRAIESPAGGSDKLILILMANHADAATGRCWASLSTLSNESGLTERGISKVINRLESGGYLRRHGRPGQSTIYTLTPELSSWVKPRKPARKNVGTPELSSVTPELSSYEPLTNPLLKKEERSLIREDQQVEDAPLVGELISHRGKKNGKGSADILGDIFGTERSE